MWDGRSRGEPRRVSGSELNLTVAARSACSRPPAATASTTALSTSMTTSWRGPKEDARQTSCIEADQNVGTSPFRP
jgi:hypothetical protein